VRRFLQLAEEGFAIVALIFYTGGPLTVVIRGGASEGEAGFTAAVGDSGLITLVFLLIYAVTFFLLAIRSQKSFYVASRNINILLLLGIAGLSVLWSVLPARTIQRVVALTGTTLLGLYLPVRYRDPKAFLILLWRTFGLILILSILFAVVLPKYGVMGGLHAGSWRGIYYHKNALGKWMVVSAIIFLLQANRRGPRNLLPWAALGLSLVLAIFSKSSAALLSWFIVVFLFFVVRILRLYYKLMVAVATTSIALAIIVFGWAMANINFIFGLLGKDPSLTGRTDLWEFVINIGFRRPWLGYGYGAFWYGERSASEEVWRAFAWHPPNSHNGFIDIWLMIGFVGALTFAFGFFANLSGAILLVHQTKTSETLLPLILLIYIALSNLTESGLMVQNDFFWVIYVSISYLVPSWLKQQAKDESEETALLRQLQ
jgi:O-antigen ligase